MRNPSTKPDKDIVELADSIKNIILKSDLKKAPYATAEGNYFYMSKNPVTGDDCWVVLIGPNDDAFLFLGENYEYNGIDYEGIIDILGDCNSVQDAYFENEESTVYEMNPVLTEVILRRIWQHFHTEGVYVPARYEKYL